jgi:hypothetical protein
MQTPIVGNWTIQVNSAKPFTIHGDLYYELRAVRIDEPESGEFVVRVPEHAVKGTAMAPRQKVQLTFLMGQVTAAEAV